jgi:hypothetical protein
MKVPTRTRSTSVTRARRWSGRRGAALVEALILIPLLLLLLVSLLYVNRAYGSKLTTMREARRDVWPKALAASSVAGGSSDGSLGSVTGQMSIGKRVARGSTLSTPLETTLSTSSASASAQAKGHDTQYGALPALSLQTSLTVINNEKQKDISTGDIQMTINALYGSLL